MESPLIQEVIVLRVSSNENKMMITSKLIQFGQSRGSQHIRRAMKIVIVCYHKTPNVDLIGVLIVILMSLWADY